MILHESEGHSAIVPLAPDLDTWWWVPYVIVRARKFIEEQETGANAENVEMSIVHGFTAGPQAGFMTVGIFEGAVLIGHLLISISEYFGNLNASVVQYALDKAVPRKFHDGAWEAICGILRDVGCCRVYSISNEKVARAHRIFLKMGNERRIQFFDLKEKEQGDGREEHINDA